MNDNDKIVEKIKKCLALSSSSNEHEAAVALRQARKLMEIYGLSEADVLAAEAEERRAEAGATSTPPSWENTLAQRVADAFGCRLIFLKGPGQWAFIGCPPSSEVAQYAFSVLYRQAKRARADHVRTRLNRCKRATKIRRADLFSEGWVWAVVSEVQSFSGTAHQYAAIEAFVAKHYPALTSLGTRNRNAGRRLNDRDLGDYDAGQLAGQGVKLSRGIEAPESSLALE
ncbi:DUF2786 domain-containing protein [Cupriavidus gilardii]|nr:DUF2786 domain-containing protein [Cupriavidus gilardii]